MRIFLVGAAEFLLGASSLAAPAPAKIEAPAAPQPVIIIDAGHGGKDLGAVIKGRYEKTLALAIAAKLKQHLQSSGQTVRMTRESDVYLPLDERVQNGLGGDLFVSLHLNDFKDKRMKGMTLYTFGKSGQRWKRVFRGLPPLPDPPREEARESAVLASALAGSLRAKGYSVNAPERAEYYVLKNPSSPAILIEMGCLSNPEEAARLSDPAYQDRLASALASSLTEYFQRPLLSKLQSSNRIPE